jgi:predicted nucleotidyltransferase
MKDRVSDLCTLIAEFAVTHRLGTVGLAGSFARGEIWPDADIDVIVVARLQMAERFAAALAERTGRTVHLHAFAALPWHHPYHLAIRWLNCRRLPVTFAPRGAVIRRVIRRDGRTLEMCVPIERIAHFAPIDRTPQATPHAGSLLVAAPPLGGFLL